MFEGSPGSPFSHPRAANENKSASHARRALDGMLKRRGEVADHITLPPSLRHPPKAQADRATVESKDCNPPFRNLPFAETDGARERVTSM